MSYTVLARKWRPQRFEEVIGQEHVTKTLARAIEAGRVAHAFLFAGPRGVGKTTTARLLARALNCADGPRPDPCGKCSSCRQITAGNDLDVVEIDAASRTKVEQIRELNETVRYQPTGGRFRIYIIDEIHMLSRSAFNALLKTLEEPPAHVKFIFATTEPGKIIPTVLSRCQRYDFKRIATREIVKQLKHIAQEEEIKITGNSLFAIAREADGSMRDAQSLLDQVTVFTGSDTVEEQDVRDALGLANRQLLLDVARAIVEGNGAFCLKAVDDIHQHGYDIPRFCQGLVELCRNLAVSRIFDDPSLLTELPEDEAKVVGEIAKGRSGEDLQRMFQLMSQGAEEVAHSSFSRLVLEMTLLKLATLPAVEPVGDLLARLRALEARLGGKGTGGQQGRGGSVAPSGGVGGRGQGVGGSGAKGLKPVQERGTATEEGGANGRQLSAGGNVSAFLAEAKKQELSLAMVLGACRIHREGNDLVKIEACSQAHFRELQDGPRKARLEEIAKRVLGSAARVQVCEPDPNSQAELEARREAERARIKNLQERAKENPAVKAALTILGGEISEINVKRHGK